MIRTAVPRPVRVGVAIAGVAGSLALAGCAPATAEAPAADVSSASPGSGGAAPYADGTYTATGSYQTPESVESISVTVTLTGDVVTAVEVTGSPTRAETKQYQSQFIGGISDVVVGKDIDAIAVSRVAGSSLTSSGFNQAIAAIKSEASR